MASCGVLGANNMAVIARIILGIFNVILSLTAITGNLLVIIVILYYKPLRKRSNFLILCLAITDLAVGIVLQPMASAQVIDATIGKSCPVAYAVTYFGAMLCGASSWILALISYDRYLRLVKLQNYTSFMTPKKLYFLLAFCWIYPILLGILMFFDATIDVYYGILVFSANINIFIIALCYRGSWKFIREKAKVFPVNQEMQGANREENNRINHHWKIAKTFALLISCFLLCWTPMVAFVVFLMIKRHATIVLGGFAEYEHTVYYVTLLLGYSNSTWNPLIYFWKNRQLKAAMKHFVLCFIFRREVVLDQNLRTIVSTQTSHA